LARKRRAERLLEKLDGQGLDLEQLRLSRTIEALERMETPEAKRVLEFLAKSLPTAVLGLEAKQALDRLAKRGLGP